MVQADPDGPAFVRRLDEGDAAAFRAVRLRALQEDSASFLATYEEDSRLSVEDFAERLRPIEPHTGVLGAFRDRQLVGTVGFYRHAHSKAGMYVVPEMRGKRIGTHLLHAAIEHARRLYLAASALQAVCSG
jgi:GNAT superfamily N-acetyltransferase